MRFYLLIILIRITYTKQLFMLFTSYIVLFDGEAVKQTQEESLVSEQEHHLQNCKLSPKVSKLVRRLLS